MRWGERQEERNVEREREREKWMEQIRTVFVLYLLVSVMGWIINLYYY